MTILQARDLQLYLAETFQEPDIIMWDNVYAAAPEDFYDECIAKAAKHQFWKEANWDEEITDCNFWVEQFNAYVKRQWARNYASGNFRTKCKPALAVWMYVTDEGITHVDATFTYEKGPGVLRQGFVVSEVPMRGMPSLKEINACSKVMLL